MSEIDKQLKDPVTDDATKATLNEERSILDENMRLARDAKAKIATSAGYDYPEYKHGAAKEPTETKIVNGTTYKKVPGGWKAVK